jgi:selenocysteine lyase/cysteine desulfurase
MIYKEEEVPTLRRARTAIAGILNVPPSWVAFGRNATDGINYAFGSLTWQPSDEVIISDQEHPALFLPPEYGARRGLYTVRTFSADPDPEVTLRHLETQISPRTRLIACSSVSSQTGIRLPSQAICALAQRHNDAGRERPILTLIDGTQELGQWRVNVPAIGCDFYVSNGHKWLGGPKGSGILVVRDRAFSLLTPPYMAGGIDEVGHPIEDMLGHRDASTMFESGTQNNAVTAVLADAVDWLDNLGWAWIEERERALAGYLRERLRAMPGMTVLTPDAWEHSSAITSFSLEAFDALHIHATLWDQRIITRYVPERNGIRIASPYFTSEEDLDRLITALEVIAEAR